MNHCGHEHHHRRREWDRTGHAAEDFARRVARDAQRFGERVAEHASGFARELAREWRHGPGDDTRPLAEDAKAVLKEVRGLVADVIDGVDELIGRLFQPEGEPQPARWTRVVTNREVDCVGCGRHIGPGEECHLRRREDGRDFRCAECGPPDGGPKSEPLPSA